MKRLRMLILLYAVHGSSIAQQAPANSDAANNPQPQAATSNVQQISPGQAESQTAPVPAAATLDDRPERISDPTQMTGSFSQALNRVHGKAGTTGGGQSAGPGMPKIELSAKVCRHNSRAAMLNVAGKNHMIKEGGKFSLLENNILYEIRVDKIENDHVEITLLPAGRKMILQ